MKVDHTLFAVAICRDGGLREANMLDQIWLYNEDEAFEHIPVDAAEDVVDLDPSDKL
jgi:hypothetical protein